jgi:uncharacterized protein YkwD
MADILNQGPQDQDPRQKKATQRVIAIAIVIVVAGGVYWYFSAKPAELQSIVSAGASAEQSAIKALTQGIVSAPPPLKQAITNLSGSGTSFTLTRAGVITDTNAQRTANGDLPTLSENATLDQIATTRLNDMFAKQYFAHVAPDGSDAQKVAAMAGYDYLAIGENLAQGNFPGDKGVVDAWMGSTGHRANILNTHYTQIGVAVKEGMFQGEKTWLAVQIFGRPASDCPAPSEALKATIDSNETQLNQTDADLAAKKADIDSSSPKYGSAYNAKIDAYNAEVVQYNDLAATTKTDVAQYNAAVQTYNACINA